MRRHLYWAVNHRSSDALQKDRAPVWSTNLAFRRGTDGVMHMAKKDEQKAEGEAGVGETTDSPLLDLTDAAVKRMIKIAKKRGWVTHDELNAVLPSEEISSDQIGDMNSMLSEM